MTIYHIHISGQVQGVGFRPWVYRLAREMLLKGWVINTTDGVHIEVNAAEDVANDFVDQLVKGAPAQAKVEKLCINKLEGQTFVDFVIKESEEQSRKTTRLSPDFAMCPQCQGELSYEADRRHSYPFITCTECGPRYSILLDIPYDRASTSMRSFKMCALCAEEYNNPADARFYSQTNSCKQCGVELCLHKADGKRIETSSPIQAISDRIREGEIVAVKGIGGFVLMCDATNENAIQVLRERKNRPAKPLALMYSDIEALQQDAVVTGEEIDLLTSAAAPIVLVRTKERSRSEVKMKNIAPNLDRLGVMMPYAPLFKLIACEHGKGLVATSGNLSGTPIIYNNEEAVTLLAAFADVIVTNNRDIIIPQDDSVAQLVNGNVNLIRRSRGYAPSYFGPLPENQINGVIAMGADLKATIAISQEGQWHVSQFLGNQESFESQKAYSDVLNHLITLSRVKPSVVLVDQHPMYCTTQLGIKWGENHSIPVVAIQHHEAHFAAVLQENNLMNCDYPVLGVVWDGTGYGHDGNSWGGEFFEYSGHAIDRIGQLNNVPVIAGDKMAKEPRISALAFCHELLKDANILLAGKFSKDEFELYTKMLDQPQRYTSSVGRLFDAVASLLGLCDRSSYEGEAAMYLQTLAARDNSGNYRCLPISMENNIVSTAPMMREILVELKEGVPTTSIAMKFHCTLVEVILTLARRNGYRNIAFSGGVFQNSLLIELMAERLTNFNLYFHKELPANDENISFGQLAHYHMTQGT